MLKKPLIIGASVSADALAPSPGKTLALRYTSIENIRTLALGGRPGRDTVKTLKAEDFQDRSIVLGLDLFFWDSARGPVEESVQALHQVISEAKKHNLPLVLGEIPELLYGKQPFRGRLNEEIIQACAAYRACTIMPLNELHEEIKRVGYLKTLRGKTLSLKEIIPDGLHVSGAASEDFADRLEKLL